MTVKITKPALNLREELADLRKPSGIAGEAVLRADTTADAREAVELSNVVDSATGVDVSGTVTADGLVVDDMTNGGLGHIRGLDASLWLDVTGGNNAKFYYDSGSLEFKATWPNAVDSSVSMKIAQNRDISFYDTTGSTAKFHWDAADERLGIGTSSPVDNLTLYDADDNVGIQFQTATSGTAGGDGFRVGQNNSSAFLWQYEALPLTFATSGSERMRLSGDKLLVGTQTDGGDGISLRPRVSGSNTTSQIRFNRADSTNAGIALLFMNDTSTVGLISYTNTATSYNTSSDYRLKEDWQPLANASDRLMQLNPVNFAWKADGSRVDGFLAHEAQEVVPEAVHGTKDAMTTEDYEVTPAVTDEDGTVVTEAVMGEREVEDYQGIDQSKLVPLLTAALQEALARIEALENK